MVSELHMPAALASEKVEVVALVDPALERAKALARSYGIAPRIAARIEDVSEKIDGVVIASPNNTHRNIALACAARGIHCLIEKPLATSVAEGEDICRAAETHNVVIAAGYSTRFRNEVVLLKHLLERNHFGAIRRFHFQEGTIGGWSPASAYNLNKAESGGGVLTVVGTHFLDRMLYWFGYPDEASMMDDADGGPESYCHVNLKFRRDGREIDGTIHLSKTFALKPGLVIDTERGRVVLGLGTSPLILKPADDPKIEMVLAPRGAPLWPRHIDNFQLQLEDFVAACRGGGKPLVDARQAQLSVKLLAELYGGRKPFPETWRESITGRSG
jgi:predicted dehydrogenase